VRPPEPFWTSIDCAMPPIIPAIFSLTAGGMSFIFSSICFICACICAAMASKSCFVIT
jgi:hypothetical protein